MTPRRPPEAVKTASVSEVVPKVLPMLVVGKVGRPYGLQGAFFVAGRDTKIPASYGSLRIGAAPETARPCVVKASKISGERPTLLCSLATSRTLASELTGQWIYAEASRVRQAAGYDLVWGELPGKAVVDSEGVSLGLITNIYNAGASDIAEVTSSDGRRLDLPLVDGFVDLAPSVDERKDLRLVVPASAFDDLWQAAPTPKKPRPATAPAKVGPAGHEGKS